MLEGEEVGTTVGFTVDGTDVGVTVGEEVSTGWIDGLSEREDVGVIEFS